MASYADSPSGATKDTIVSTKAPPADEDDLDPAAFLKSVRELSAKREREDNERFRKLEQEIEKGRQERLARRAGMLIRCFSHQSLTSCNRVRSINLTREARLRVSPITNTIAGPASQDFGRCQCARVHANFHEDDQRDTLQ